MAQTPESLSESPWPVTCRGDPSAEKLCAGSKDDQTSRHSSQSFVQRGDLILPENVLKTQIGPPSRWPQSVQTQTIMTYANVAVCLGTKTKRIMVMRN